MQPVQVVEPTLEGYSGHCHALVSSLCHALAGMPVELWSAKAAAGLAFGAHVTQHAMFSRRLRLVQAYFLYRRLLRAGAPVVVTTARRSDLVLLDHAAGGPIPGGRAFLYFHWLRESPAKLRALRALAKRQPHLAILGTTASVVDAFRRCGFANVRLLPYPPPPAGDDASPAAFAQLLYAGAARQDKGFPLVADLAALMAREGDATPLAVQVSADHYGKYDARTRADIERLRASGHRALRLIEQSLQPQEYAGLFRGSICLQPYDREAFRDRVSGVTLDALTHACPVVATAGTWSAELVDRHGAGVALEDLSAGGLLAAVREVQRDYAGFQQRARLAGEALNRESWHPLLDQLPATPVRRG
ncbi:MAG TPA: hypothetical protein VFV71_00185 [Burkholderiales bacterium]|nr:hypothetical protein [Burkholderiales bacterium]